MLDCWEAIADVAQVLMMDELLYQTKTVFSVLP